MANVVREIDNETLIRRLDPTHFTEKDILAVFGGGRVVQYEDQHRPPEPYWWYPVLEEDE